jgi:recombination protein RecA
MAVDSGMVVRSGAWYSCGDERIGQGRENAKGFLREHPEMMEELEVKLKEESGLQPAEEIAEGEEA